VRSDGLDVAVSKAVESVRGVLVDGSQQLRGSIRSRGSIDSLRSAATAGLPMTRTLSSSPGSMRGGLSGFVGGGERERRKSVKFVADDDAGDAG